MTTNTENIPTFYQKLRKKQVSFISSIFIVLVSLMSIFAYVFIDDKTPDANDQLPEIALSEPGFSTKMLLIPRKTERKEKSWLSKLFTGSPNNFEYQPFKEIKFGDKEVEIITHFDQLKYLPYTDLVTPEILNSKKVQSYIKENNIASKSFIFGTDKYGRSIFSRLVLGMRISLSVGFLAVVISLTVGIFLGSISAYFGGWIDQLVMFLINVTWSIPTLLLVFAIVLAFGRGIGIIFLAVGLTMWVDVARIVRGQVKKVKEEQYIIAAKSLGYGTYKIIFQHILPNIIGPILVIAAANFATAILLEAGLSYLGFGIKPPSPSIGNMLNENYGYALSNKPFLAIIPAFTIMLLVLSFNLVGSGLRDIFDVKQKTI